jgi:hypothetical protein
MNTAAAEVLAFDVEQALITAGLHIADPDNTTRDGYAASGAGVSVADMRIHGGEWAVMLTWGMSDAADFRTVDIMLAAVAEVLRVHGFEVEQHPVGMAYLVTGRRR